MKVWKIPLKEKKIPSQGFFINFLKNYQDTGFTEHLYVAASGQLKMAGALRYYATFNFWKTQNLFGSC